MAANVGYGWWSHDIGGHMGCVENDELYARWVHYGVLSPILRLHSTINTYYERRPWGRGPAAESAATQAMRLRHSLIPRGRTFELHLRGVTNPSEMQNRIVGKS